LNTVEGTKIFIGEEVTAVSKGIHHGYGSDWVDSSLAGQVHYLKVTRIGIKFLYGNFIYFDPATGNREDRDWETDTNSEEYVIHEGIRKDLEKQHRDFTKAQEEHEKAYGFSLSHWSRSFDLSAS
jgi:hypothetical protein